MIKVGPRRFFDQRTAGLHVLCWLLFILYELFFLYYMLQKFTAASASRYLLYYLVNIAIFYSHLFVLDMAFKPGGNFLKAAGLFLAQFVIFLLVKGGLDLLFGPPFSTVPAALVTLKTYFYLNVYRAANFCIYASFFWVAGNIAGFRKRAARAEKDFAEAQLAYLQQQMQPHLLFNTLSFIYSSVYAHSAPASRCVLLLSDIMRFSLEKTGGDGKTALAKELEQVSNLVEINRYRYDTELCLAVRLEADGQPWRIIPLVLLTLTENLFKHGHLTDPAYPALLEIRVDPDGQLHYLSQNRRRAKAREPGAGSLGLRNTRLRLEQSYPGRYRLETRETDEEYELQLTLSL